MRKPFMSIFRRINELNQDTLTQSDELSKCLFYRFYTFLSLLEMTIALQMTLCIHRFPSNMISTIRIYELNLPLNAVDSSSIMPIRPPSCQYIIILRIPYRSRLRHLYFRL